MRLNLKADLTGARETATFTVDQDAEAARTALNVNAMTAGCGQQHAYRWKREEAERFLANPTLGPEQAPHLFAEVGITADTAMGVAQIILQRDLCLREISPKIERARLAAKKAIREANSLHEIAVAMQIDFDAIIREARSGQS
jgi:hypothetical protein